MNLKGMIFTFHVDPRDSDSISAFGADDPAQCVPCPLLSMESPSSSTT